MTAIHEAIVEAGRLLVADLPADDIGVVEDETCESGNKPIVFGLYREGEYLEEVTIRRNRAIELYFELGALLGIPPR